MASIRTIDVLANAVTLGTLEDISSERITEDTFTAPPTESFRFSSHYATPDGWYPIAVSFGDVTAFEYPDDFHFLLMVQGDPLTVPALDPVIGPAGRTSRFRFS